METATMTIGEATYRVQLKRILRKGLGTISDIAPTNLLEAQVKKLAVYAPQLVASSLEATYHEAARMWERGNNSGDARTLERCEKECDRLRDGADSVMTLLRIFVDYPGLYPSFRFQDADYHSCESVLRAYHRACSQ